MSRRRSRSRPRPAPPRTAPRPADADPCPCGSGCGYGDCCGRYHRGLAAAPTAEALMRSRYSAFAVCDAAYLLRTWHPATRPGTPGLDPAIRWSGLDILATSEGSAFHTTGTVTFRAHYSERGRPGTLEEKSRFTRHEGAWVYLDAL